MSAFVVGVDHIDYLVSAVLHYAGADPAVAGRSPDELGAMFLQDNIDAVYGKYFSDDDDEEEYSEMGEEREQYQQLQESYRYRPVENLEPLQAAAVARCWQYQQGETPDDDTPKPSWILADRVATAALAELPPDLFTDPTRPRDLDGLASQDGYTWPWRRERP